MKRLFLTIGFLLGLTTLATAQCAGVGGVNTVPQIGAACLSEPSIDSYAATGIAIVPAAAATDIACITGSTRVVRLQSIRVVGTGTAITIPVIITKHASVNTGGTPATGTALPVPYALDSTDTAVTATTTAYTANPTITDAAPGLIDAQFLGLAATTTSTAGNITFNYDSRNFIEPPIIRSTAQQICVNLNGTSPTASLTVTFRWTEAAQ